MLKSKSSGGSSTGKGSYGYQDITTPIVPGPVVQPEESIFVDITTDHYAYEAIETLYDRGIISGDGTKHIYPNIGITREETAKIAIAINNIDVRTGLPINFDDADQVSDWAKYILATAIDERILVG